MMPRWVIGVVVASIVTVACAIGVLVTLTSSGATSVLDLELGDCFELPVHPVEIDEVDLVRCDDPHDAEVVMIGLLNEAGTLPYPSDEDLFAAIDARCATLTELEGFGLLPVAPNEASWAPFNGRFVCVAVPIGGERSLGSVAGLG